MNLTFVAYFIYFILTTSIIVKVGHVCYTRGNVFVAALLPDHEKLCKQINQTLLVGYYLLNLGYCATTLLNWKTIATIDQVLEVVFLKTAIILFIIAFLHYINIFIIVKYIKTKH